MPVPLALLALAWALVAYVIYSLVTGVLRSRRNVTKALELNCQEPAIQKNRLPFGLDQLQRAMKADKAQMFPSDAIQRTHDVGAITYRYSMLGTTNIFTADEQNIQAVLAKQFKDFELGPIRRGNFMPLLGNGIFSQDPHNGWDHSRAMMRPQFAREQISDLDLEEKHVQNMMKALIPKPVSEDGWTDTVDLSVLFFRLTLDSATEFLFGESVNSQLVVLPDRAPSKKKSTNSPDSERFAYAFDRAQMHLARRARFQNLFALHNPADFRKCCTDVHTFIDHFVRLALSQEAREKELEKGGAGKEKYVFLEALARETQDPMELRSQLLHMLLAGRDTTASLLGWLFYSLARDSHRYAKLRQIVVDEFGTYEEPKEITFAGLKGCGYLQHCMNESLRLYPVVPINSRRATRDTTLPRGGGPDGKSKVFVPKGTQVDYSVHVMHHRKDIWGEDVEEWRPERWEGRRVGWEFLPFNGGPRICIGQQFALTEASYVTVRLLQRFDAIQNCETESQVKHNLTLINCSGNGVKVRLRKVA